MFGIKGYPPKFYENSSNVLHDLKHDFQKLKGQKTKPRLPSITRNRAFCLASTLQKVIINPS